MKVWAITPTGHPNVDPEDLGFGVWGLGLWSDVDPGIMENKMETTTVTTVCKVILGILEKKMETTIESFCLNLSPAD